MFSKFTKDFLERVLWTLAQVALSFLTAELFDLPAWAIPIMATALAAAKAFVARKVGDPNSAATLK